jgi:hypothetical protein
VTKFVLQGRYGRWWNKRDNDEERTIEHCGTSWNVVVLSGESPRRKEGEQSRPRRPR